MWMPAAASRLPASGTTATRSITLTPSRHHPLPRHPLTRHPFLYPLSLSPCLSRRGEKLCHWSVGPTLPALDSRPGQTRTPRQAMASTSHPSSPASGEEGDPPPGEGGDPPPGSPKVLVFTTEACRFCRAAKAALAAAGVDYKEVIVGTGMGGSAAAAAETRRTLAESSGIPTVPVVYASGRLVGGSEALQKSLDSGELQDILSGVNQPLPPGILSILQQAQQQPGKTVLPPAPEGAVGAISEESLSPTEKNAGGPVWGGLPPEEVEEALSIYSRMLDPDEGVPREDRRVASGNSGPLALLFPQEEKRVFSGAAAVSWLQANSPGGAEKSTEAAVSLAQRLEHMGLLHHTTCSMPFENSPDVFFRLLHDEAPMSSALNAHPPWLRPARPAADVAGELRARTLALYEEGLSADGSRVDYNRLASSGTYRAYREGTAELQKVDVLALGRPEQKAFWLNTYNALTVHGLIAKGQPASLLQRLGFYSSTKYLIAGLEFSLDDIEHGVLRANRSSNPGKGAVFGGRDPRRYYSLPPLDPRIHFALNCGAKSCPPIKLYSGGNLEEELDAAAAAFLSGDVTVEGGGEEKGEVEVSKLLQWYGGDFGETDEQRLRWMLPFLGVRQREQVEGVVGKFGDRVRLKFRAYDWDPNTM